MRQSRRRTSRRTADERIKYIRMAAIPLVIVMILVIIIVVMDRRTRVREEGASSEGETTWLEENDGQSEAGFGEKAEEPDNNQYIADFSQYELQKDAIPQVNLLISDYFQAKVDQDVEKLFALFGKAVDEESLKERKEELQNEAVYIQDYEDITCYTKPGLTEDSYVVYVTYDVKFKRVETAAPGLMWCYVLKDENGSFMIREHVIGEEADYVAKQNQTEDVRLLSNQVNEQLRQALESDTLLAGIYKNLRNGAVVSGEDGEAEDGEDSMISLDEGKNVQSEEGTQDSSKETAASSEADRAGEGQSFAETSPASGESSIVTLQ